MSSQIVGVLAAAAQSDTDAAKLETGSWVAKNATQYNYLSHNQLERAAKQIARCTDASCIQDATRKFQELSLQQDIDAIVSCQADPSSCAASSKEVASTMANLNAIRDIADYASPDAREAVQSLINGNYEFQEMLATATTEHSVGAMVESLKSKWALSDAQAQDIAHNLKIALAVGVGTAAGVVAYRRAVAGGAKGAGTLANAGRGTLTEANFAQNKIKSDRSFSEEGQKVYSELAGTPIKTVDDLASALRAGTIKPNQLPVDYVDMKGTRLILNTRTSTALEQAAIPRSEWFGRNQTGVEAYPGKTFNDLAADQLKNNKLPPTGAEQLKSVRP
ncbi:hypothetical protein HT121_16655 [Pseudomonas sp. MAFF 301514]|nr:hypothetical protein [Pseudomonas allii]NWN49127.1 hypothetical protein [Pseudomonas allii]